MNPCVSASRWVRSLPRSRRGPFDRPQSSASRGRRVYGPSRRLPALKLSRSSLAPLLERVHDHLPRFGWVETRLRSHDHAREISSRPRRGAVTSGTEVGLARASATTSNGFLRRLLGPHKMATEIVSLKSTTSLDGHGDAPSPSGKFSEDLLIKGVKERVAVIPWSEHGGRRPSLHRSSAVIPPHVFPPPTFGIDPSRNEKKMSVA